MSFYREMLESWLRKIDIKANRVLDLGGASNPVTFRLHSFQADEYIVFDLGIEEPKTEYLTFDINKPLRQLKCKESSFRFDVIFCLEVFEYVWNPVEAIKNINKFLCEGGIAYISFSSVYPVHNPVEIDYLRYTKKAIEKYFSLFNLQILEIVPRPATHGGQSLSQFYSEEGMHPLRKSELPFDLGYLVKVVKPYRKKIKKGV